MAEVPKIKLNNGLWMPAFGLGTYAVNNVKLLQFFSTILKFSFNFYCLSILIKMNICILLVCYHSIILLLFCLFLFLAFLFVCWCHK